MSPRVLGEVEQLILLALIALPAKERYGVPIREEIERRTGRSLSAGAVYTALDRLTTRGLVSSELGEPTAERGGRAKRLYTVEPAGAKALARSLETIESMAQGLRPSVDRLVGR